MPNIFDLFNLRGQVALVTGARNLGYYTAQTLAELGATVMITTRSIQTAEETAAKLTKETGAAVRGISLEATDEAQWQAVIGRICHEYGRLDILVNNAGGRKPEVRLPGSEPAPVGSFLEDRSIDAWRQNTRINLDSVFLGCRSAIGIMMKQQSGKIVNMASIDGMVGRDLELYADTGLSPTIPDYLACKAAVINLTRGIAVAYARYGITCNSISPGGFQRGQPDVFVKKYAGRVPLGRMGRDDTDLKGAIAYLCSAASDYVTGHNLVVDGGWTAW